MIGTFWNLCRACPSMPVDKLHSEYRSTYRWHEYTGPRQDVVRKPPQPITGGRPEEEVTKNAENAPPIQGGGMEPAMSRRKKYPTIAYRSNAFITSDQRQAPSRHLSTSLDRATMISGYPQESNHSGGLKSAISRISTEYRLQFSWPRGLKQRESEEERSASGPRKSVSMGAIKPTSNSGPPSNNIPPPAPVHKKRITEADKLDGSAELEPLVSDQDGVENSGEEKIQEESLSKEEKPQLRAEFKTEYKKKFRPFSQYDYVEGRFKPKRDEPEPEIVPDLPHGDSWFREVLELRKKAGEYKHRGWGTELVPEHIAELYNKQMSLWEQVSRRSSLSALSLASSTHRSITKEEKEKENNKKSSPTKYPWPRTTTKTMTNKTDKMDEYKKEIPPRTRVDNIIRHHLERTTGSGGEGILQSPTREKLEPVIPRRKEPSSEANKSPQKTQQHSTGRSQSVGPNTTYPENRSPKRTPRVAQSTPKTTQVIAASEKKPRPTTLPTAPSRTKPLTGSVKVSEAKTKATQGIRKAKENSSPNTNKPKESKLYCDNPQSLRRKMASKRRNMFQKNKTQETTENEEKATEEVETSEAEVIEAVVKSPPEPTRVKSPEQILIRSPEPVNWTVPLDTGKTFTVTQNVNQGDSICRPQSESRMVTAITHPPPAPPQSAPPQLQQDIDVKNDKDEDTTPLSCEKPVAGTTLRCLEDPSFSFDSGQQEQRSLSSDIMEKARTRFDQFWGKSNQDSAEKEEQL